jgi:tetratricopeptide (TPR) repeat protein
MKLMVWLTATTIGLTISQPGYAATTRQVYDIAKSVTAKIDVSQNGQSIARGSGFLLKKRGRVYSLITSKHVTRCLENSCTYTITTADGRRHLVESTKIKVSSGLDLATIEFTSLNNYPLAQLGNSSAVKPGDIIYTSGFPIEASGFTFAGGEVLVNAQRRLAGDRGGYSLVYSAYTNKGMSGGAVFDEQGRVVAIHGHGDRVTVGTYWQDPNNKSTRSNQIYSDIDGKKMGFNRGVSTQWLLNSGLVQTPGDISIKPPQGADDFLILGMNKFITPDSNNIKQDKQQALAYFNRAIQLQPNYPMPYFLRSLVNIQFGNNSEARQDVMKTYQLSSALFIPSPYVSKPISVDRLDGWLQNNRNFMLANRLGVEVATELSQLRQNSRRHRQTSPINASYQTALQKLDRAIQIYPHNLPDFYLNLNLANLYIVRAELKKISPGNEAASIADFEKASEIYPVSEYAYSYFQRGYWREAGGNRSGAMADYRQAALLAQKEGDTTTLQMANASLNPNSSKRQVGFVPTAINANLNPNRSHQQGGFIPTAIQTRSRAISTKSTPTPNATQAKIYVRMAYIAAKKKHDRKTAIIYLQKAAELYKQDGNMTKYQDIMTVIRKYTDTDIQ